MFKAKSTLTTRIGSAALSLLFLLAPLSPVVAAKQDPVTGAFSGVVSEAGPSPRTIPGANVEVVNDQTGAKYRRVTDAVGGFYVGRLSPGWYTITVSHRDYQQETVKQRVRITQVNQVIPLPVALRPLVSAAPPTTVATGPTPDPGAPGTPQPTPAASPEEVETEEDRVNLQVGRLDGRRGGGYNENQVVTLPLGAATYVRTFDELALLLPGVVLPPYSLGNIAGPGVGAGVGSPGQFSVNGLPPRANNFTVDGSDNNDEDIGVRRQGFFSLVPQPVESIKEYQVITLLAPAQYGRNIGAQVNAVSKSGGNDVHGDLYGFFNSSRLNSRNTFDTDGENGPLPVASAGGRPAVLCPGFNTTCNSGGTPINVNRGFGGEDSSTLGQFGFTLGGPIKKERWFYFLSGERQILNAGQEKSFAVPTLEQRGYGIGQDQAVVTPQDPRSGSGATGITTDPVSNTATPGTLVPQTVFGAAIFSLFPFPNNPAGVYGRNTFTQVLPASARGTVASGKIDYVNSESRLFQSFTARYNFTKDWRDIPAAGEAIFATLRPEVRTQNISTFINSQFSGDDARTQVNNQLRLSYGRTRLNFDEVRDTTSLLSSRFNQPFLLNAPLIQDVATTTTGVVPFTRVAGGGTNGTTCVNNTSVFTTECITGPLGQVIIGGFSPVGVDVFNFPQRRVNNTYQLADTVTIRQSGEMAVTYTLGADLRRTELNSDLPRNSRPLATFYGSTALRNDIRPASQGGCEGICEVANVPYIPGTWFAAGGLPQGFYHNLAAQDNESGNIGLRYYQLNFFGQEDFRLTNTLSLTLGMRYEYNTPAREINDRIESTFGLPAALDPTGGVLFSEERESIYDPDRNNFAPRIGIAWAPNVFGADRPTVMRGGFGVYYDQILGAVVSQSRNVYPNFLPLNLASRNNKASFAGIDPTTGLPIFNPVSFAPVSSLSVGFIDPNNAGGNVLGPCIIPINPFCIGPGIPLLDPNRPNNLNTLNPVFAINNVNNVGSLLFALRRDLEGGSLAFTLPSRQLQMPMAYHYSYTIEQGLPNNMLLSFAYVGTRGRNLIRFSTPNGGPNTFPVTSQIAGRALPGGRNPEPTFAGTAVSPVLFLQPIRANALLGPINLFESTGRSQYDAVQVQLRGRLGRERAFLYQIGYTYSRSRDSVSDVFDLAGAPALPQQSSTFTQSGPVPILGGDFPGEYARSNYDTPHRVPYDLVWDIVPGNNGFQLASTGMFQSGQPFTVNTIIDINRDGNLTDRLNTTSGLSLNGSDRQPIQLVPGNSGETLSCRIGQDFIRTIPVTGSNTRSLLPCQGFNGALPRNSFRAGSFRLVNLTAIKKFSLGETTFLSARLDIFNLLNRDNFNIPVRILESPGFGSATETVTPGRRLQFALKLSF
ncbi:MAG: carboxypeptidase-like regulatory domain-containing protein [Pyrinomonadaceae bacterium]